MIPRWSLALLGLLAVLLAVPSTALAQALEDYDYENLSFTGVGLEYGRIWPTKVEPAAAYTLKADLGYLGPGVRIVPSLTYWSSTLEAAELGRLAGQLSRLDALRRQGAEVTADDLGEIEWSDVALALDGQYVLGLRGSVQAYLGAGLGLHVFNGSGPAIEDTFIDDLLDSITAGLGAMAGVETTPVDRLRIHIEGRYTLLDDVRYPEVRIGGAFVLPARGVAGGPR